MAISSIRKWTFTFVDLEAEQTSYCYYIIIIPFMVETSQEQINLKTLPKIFTY